MIKSAITVAALMACSVPVFAATDYPSANLQKTLPGEGTAVTDWCKQNVYDPNENKIGDIKDVLVDKSGRSWRLLSASAAFSVRERKMSPYPSRLYILP